MLDRLDITKMREAGQLAAHILEEISFIIKEGISTLDIDHYARDLLIKAGARSASFGYNGFPGHLCTSLNDVVCHGIPSDKLILKNGDFLNVDLALELNGHYGDSSRCFTIGKMKPAVKELIDTTYHAMWAAIEVCRPGMKVNEIGKTIEMFLKKSKKDYGIIRKFCGHGIGKNMHQDPDVPHYYEVFNDHILSPGMCITIEPMINGSKNYGCRVLEDNWTAKTLDGSPSAQWEHTIYITDDGYEVMTYNNYDAKKNKPRTKGQRCN